MNSSKKQQEFRMFSNPVLELLSMSGPIMMTIFHLIVASTLIIVGIRSEIHVNLIEVLMYFLLGMLSWSLAEYLMHRYVFHFVNEWKWIQHFHFAMHGYHHNTPHDHNRLFMPPVPAALFLALFGGIFSLFLGVKTLYFLPGFEIGYLLYASIHYLVHTRVPKHPYLKKLWLHHANHHYKTPEKAFGVSSQLWDRVFQTMPSELENKSLGENR